tara:strand:+ start:189652 stop:190860 length:1209 start_codon:yes stop_codon:yes gene_type:complete
MKLVLFLIAFTFYSFSCEVNSIHSELLQHAQDFSNELSPSINEQICNEFSEIETDDELKKHINVLVQNQTNEIWKIKNRHDMGNALNECSPTKNSKGLVISFAGTGAFNPRTHSLMAKLIKCESIQSLPEWMKKHLYAKVLNSLKSKGSSYTKWSGIEKGIMSEMILNPELNKESRNLNFAIFPSEESELIADPDKINFSKLKDITKEMSKSYAGFPTGIKNALGCAVTYFSEAKELGIKPNLIVISHSSGGRSVVKFLEKLKLFLPEQDAELVMTIDPVKEAHHAIQEVASQYAGKVGDEILDYIPFVDIDNDKPVNVWTRKQPKTLYKTSNSVKWINFYQNVDSHGLGMAPKFGIHGSPIENADNNYFIKGLGNKAHGEICYDEEVINKMNKAILNSLLN